MVLGQLIFKARIDYSLWDKILGFAYDEANEGYTGLLDYLEEPVNCRCECIEGTKWCEIKLGADSFRETEWAAIHKIISCIIWYTTLHDLTAMQYYEWEGLEINNAYMNLLDPFDPSKVAESWLEEHKHSFTPAQVKGAYCQILPLKKGYPFISEEHEEE